MPPKFIRKKKIKKEKDVVKSKLRIPKKKKKLVTPEVQIEPLVKKLAELRLSKNKAVREISNIVSERAGFPVRCVYHPGLDSIEKEERDKTYFPFIRSMETDTPLAIKPTFCFIIVSDGVFKTEQIFLKMIQGQMNRWGIRGKMIRE